MALLSSSPQAESVGSGRIAAGAPEAHEIADGIGVGDGRRRRESTTWSVDELALRKVALAMVDTKPPLLKSPKKPQRSSASATCKSSSGEVSDEEEFLSAVEND